MLFPHFSGLTSEDSEVSVTRGLNRVEGPPVSMAVLAAPQGRQIEMPSSKRNLKVCIFNIRWRKSQLKY